jgi:hypothetical protein
MTSTSSSISSSTSSIPVGTAAISVGSSSSKSSSSSERESNMDERIESVDTEDTDEGVRSSETLERYDTLGLCTDGDVGTEMSDGDGTEIDGVPGSESEPVSETEMDGVGAGCNERVRVEDTVGAEDDADDADETRTDDGDEMDVLISAVLSGIVLRRRMSGDVRADALGRRKDVSKDMSGPSGNATDCTDGEAARMEDSYDSSLSEAHIEPWIEGVPRRSKRDGGRVEGG